MKILISFTSNNDEDLSIMRSKAEDLKSRIKLNADIDIVDGNNLNERNLLNKNFDWIIQYNSMTNEFEHFNCTGDNSQTYDSLFI